MFAEELLVVRVRHGSNRVEGGQDEALLVIVEVNGDHGHRHLPVRQSELNPQVAVYQPEVGVTAALRWRHADRRSLSRLPVPGLQGNLFITNSVACRPRNPVKPSRTPSPGAIRACQGRLALDISAHDRAVIVALGATAIRAVTGLRGSLVRKKGPGTEPPSEWGRVVPTLHPAYDLCRGLNGPEYQMLVEDPRHARRITYGPGV